MSEPPKRFDDVIDMLTHDCHKYALEVARLKAERVHDLNQIGGLQEENARLKAEVERLEHQVNYWRIEAEVDNARWLRCLQDLEELRSSSFVTAVPVEEYEKLKAEVERLTDAITRGACIPDAKAE